MSRTERLVAPHLERLGAYRPGRPLEQLERELGIRDAIKRASNDNPLGPSPVRSLRLSARWPTAIAIPTTTRCAKRSPPTMSVVENDRLLTTIKELSR